MKPRADWRPGLRKYPYGVRAMSAGAGWREDTVYEFTASQIDLIESVADELHSMIAVAVRHVMEHKLFASLGIRMLLTVARSLGRAKAQFVLFGATPVVMEILETTAISEIIPVFGTEAEALAALSG